MAGTVIGIWLNAGLLTGPYAPYATVVLGVLLVIYAVVGLSRSSFKVASKDEKWIGGIVGVTTGLISAATGEVILPMPFRRSAWRRTNWCRRSACSSRSTVALAFNLTASGLLTAATALPGAIAMVASFTGMFIGQAVRTRMPDVFRRWP